MLRWPPPEPFLSASTMPTRRHQAYVFAYSRFIHFRRSPSLHDLLDYRDIHIAFLPPVRCVSG